jgi:lipid-binding SYLF domain-containing protein
MRLFSKEKLFVLVLLGTLCACSSQPLKHSDLSESEIADAHEALLMLQKEEKLAPYFAQAVAFAVYPAMGRAGLGFGGAYGTGMVFKDDQVIGTTSLTQVNVGFNAGIQFYRQILFFKSAGVLDHFKRGNLELGGQFNTALITLGGGVTPAYLDDIAIFTQLRGGLLIEASIGGHYYGFTPLQR